ncbi:MAG: PAS domain-containing protein [Candidatus Omnitrophica bacterium]|nr:PAS domain-containing protein [Candidatus Omnitrophota bacterium]
MSIRSKLTLTFLAIAFIPALLISILTFTKYENNFKADRISDMEDIAAYKADKIETYFSWLQLQIEIVQSLLNVKNNFPVLVQFSSVPENPKFLTAKKTLDGQLQRIQSLLGLLDIMLVNSEGKIVYASNSRYFSENFLNSLPDPAQKAFIEGKNKIYFSDIYLKKKGSDQFAMLVTAPALDINNNVIGVIAFDVDLPSIYKVMQGATGLGKTGETLLGKKIGNQVLVLSSLKYASNAPLNKRVNIGDVNGFAIQQAVQGKNGVGEFLDYRGEKTIGAWRYIPSLDWGMVAKIDKTEAFGDIYNLKKKVILILFIIMGFIGIAGIAIAKTISNPINKLSKGAEIIGRGNLDYKVGIGLKDEVGQLSRSFDKMTQELKQHRDNLEGLVAERTTELNRLNRILKALSNSNYASTRLSDEPTYLQEICKIIVEDCGYEMVWIGYAVEDEEKSIVPVAYAGFEKGYLETLNLTWADAERGRGPTGTAIRTGKLVICKNMHTDPLFTPWREEAIKRGYAASISLPLISEGKTFGALTMYAKEPDPFSEEDVKLFTELVDDIASGIITIRLRKENKLSEEALKLREEKIEEQFNELIQIYKYTPVGLFVLDRDMRFIRVNDRLAETNGKSMEEHLGHSVSEVISESMAKELAQLWKPIFEKGEPVLDVEVKGETAKMPGVERYWLGNYFPYRSAEGVVIGLMGAVLEISERKAMEKDLEKSRNELELRVNQRTAELRQANELMEKIFSTAHFSIVYLDPKFNFIRVNKSYAQACGYTPEFFIGKNHFDLYPHDENRAIFENVVKTGQPFSVFAKPFSFPDHPEWGVTYWDWSLLPVKDGIGAVEGLVFCLVDVTKRTQAEEELEKTRMQLEAAKRLSDIGTLAATVAHELRNPLAAINMAAYNIQRKAKNPLLDSHIEVIGRKINESDQIINNLLFYTRIKPPKHESINLYDIVKECFILAKERNANLNVTVIQRLDKIKSVSMDGDLVQLQEIFSNIINNAFDAMRTQGGKMTIMGDIEDGRVQIKISDEGLGIDAENLKRVFDPFFTTKAQGTGLGLTVCKQIVTLHGGTIDITSKKGEGTTVSVQLPINRENHG